MTILSLRGALILVTDRWCEAADRSRSRLSTRLFSSGSRIDALASGGDLTTTSYERAMQWLSDNWPEGHAWPAEVARPAPSSAPLLPGAAAAGSSPSTVPNGEPAALAEDVA